MKNWTPFLFEESSLEDLYGSSVFLPLCQKCEHIVIGVCQYKCDPAELLWCSRAIITSSHCCDELILSVCAPNIVILISSLYDIVNFVITRRNTQSDFFYFIKIYTHRHAHRQAQAHITCQYKPTSRQLIFCIFTFPFSLSPFHFHNLGTFYHVHLFHPILM